MGLLHGGFSLLFPYLVRDRKQKWYAALEGEMIEAREGEGGDIPDFSKT